MVAKKLAHYAGQTKVRFCKTPIMLLSRHGWGEGVGFGQEKGVLFLGGCFLWKGRHPCVWLQCVDPSWETQKTLLV